MGPPRAMASPMARGINVRRCAVTTRRAGISDLALWLLAKRMHKRRQRNAKRHAKNHGLR